MRDPNGRDRPLNDAPLRRAFTFAGFRVHHPRIWRSTSPECALTGLPWNARDEERIDLRRAGELLDEGHWGLAEAKARLLEHLAVRKLGGGRGAVLCLVGPPGVGKTSLAQDIARAMGRKFATLSFAGMSDGTELRGHNRTWRAAQPGRLVRELVRIGSKNPVLLLDEVDKISRVPNSGGDPESALLEVLDPVQNRGFVDNYVEVPFDLSETFFVATANVWGRIADPLRDRLELIEVPGYSEDEKLEIARAYLVGRQLDANGLAAERVRFTDGALLTLIRGYTREAGVRDLGRRIGAVCRKVALRRVGETSRRSRSRSRWSPTCWAGRRTPTKRRRGASNAPAWRWGCRGRPSAATCCSSKPAGCPAAER